MRLTNRWANERYGCMLTMKAVRLSGDTTALWTSVKGEEYVYCHIQLHISFSFSHYVNIYIYIFLRYCCCRVSEPYLIIEKI